MKHTQKIRCTCTNLCQAENCDKDCDWHEATSADATQNTEEVKRYKCELVLSRYDDEDDEAEMQLSADGDYVSFSDYDTLRAERDLFKSKCSEYSIDLNVIGKQRDEAVELLLETSEIIVRESDTIKKLGGGDLSGLMKRLASFLTNSKQG